MYEIFDNLDDILFGEHPDIHVSVESEFFVDTIASHITEVVAFVGEEEVLNYLPCACVIGRVSISQLSVYIEHSLFLRV